MRDAVAAGVDELAGERDVVVGGEEGLGDVAPHAGEVVAERWVVHLARRVRAHQELQRARIHGAVLQAGGERGACAGRRRAADLVEEAQVALVEAGGGEYNAIARDDARCGEAYWWGSNT